jgi:hypothetical protein
MAQELLLLYFDILGFKKLVQRQPLDVMVKRFDQIYSALGETAVNYETREAEAVSIVATVERQEAIASAGRGGKRAAFEAATGMTLLMMSDSIIIYSQPISRAHAEFQNRVAAMLRIGRSVLDKLLEYGLPARGAVSFGEFYAAPVDGVYVGRALVEAYEWAESQDWIGAVVAPSLAADVEVMQQAAVDSEWRSNRGMALPGWDYVLWDVPFKKARDCGRLWCRIRRSLTRFNLLESHCRHEWLGTERLYALNWATSPHASRFAQSQITNDGLRAGPEVARKYRNTLLFLERTMREGLRGLTLV